MRFVRSGFYCLWTVHIVSTLNYTPIIFKNQRMKRNADDNFKLLLNLYKINPLRRSKVFNMFSNKIFLTNRAGSEEPYALNVDEKESDRGKKTRAVQNLKEIEDTIHAVPKSQKRNIERPTFLDDSITPEQFSDVPTATELNKFNVLKPKQDSFDDIFGHIVESKESVHDIPITDRFDNEQDRIPVAVAPPDFVDLDNNDDDNKLQDDGVVVFR